MDFLHELISLWATLLSPGATQHLDDNVLFLRHGIGKDFKRLENDSFNKLISGLASGFKSSELYFN